MRRRSPLVPVSALLFVAASMALGQDSPTDERDRAVMNRFLGVVEKAPRRGTALDRVYGYHVERGTLDAFLKAYQDRTAANPKDGAAWLILGLVESQRGRDAAAVAALRKAEAARPDDPMPSYYLGQSLVLVGQPDDAAQAFERAIDRKPNRADLLEIFQALGRVYQRAHRNEQALAVWSRLEKIFPDDPRVQEQIAASLAEESLPDQALPRYEALAKATKDKFRQVQFQVDAAELKVRLNRTADAMADFEGLLGRLDPESWLHREVRRKIEEIYTRGDDLAGLANYYEGWIKKNPEDVEAMSRLGKALGSQGRLSEARGWYEKAVKLAPTRRDLRSSLIEQLVIEKKYPEAAAQYEAIAKTDPNNPDVIREWGRLLLRDDSRPEPERKKAAAAIWRRMTDARPDDPSTMVAVADLFRSAEMVDDAIALYKAAVAKSPGSPQYAEYLGEFYHRLKRPAEAVATWSRMAEPPNRNAKTLGRLAEVLSGFGYKLESLAAATEAAGLDRDDFDLQLRLADLLRAAEKLDDEAKQLELAAKAATSEEQTEGVLDRQIKNAQLAGRLGARIEAIRQEVEAKPDATSEQWRVLARYVEADQKPAEALTLARKAVATDPKSKSIPALAMVARLEEATGNLSGATLTLRKLAEVDRRGRTEYLTGVARLEARLGRKDAALKAGRDLLAAAPGQLDNHQFFAELCFQLGQVDEGLDALRRAVRLNEADPKALLGLAETLANQFRTEEAIEMFWRAFDKAADLEARLPIVTRLTALYLQRNQFDRLIARLERQGREADRQREMTICLAQAYSASGDFGTARAELERLLSTNPRDTKLLHQLAVLSESEGDPSTASKFQKQLVDIAPSDESNAKLAQFYIQAGEIGEAEALWTRLTTDGQPESHRVLTALDTLLGTGKKEAILGITENLLRRRPDDWEALYREAQALAALDRPQDAANRFRKILTLKGNDDDVGSVARARKRAAQQSGDPNAPVTSTTNYYAPTKTFPLQDRISRVYNVRGASGIDPRYGSSSAWSPDDLGQARMASVGWLYSLATKAGNPDGFLAELRQAAEKAPARPGPALEPLLPPTAPARIRRPVRRGEGARQGRADRSHRAVRLPQRPADPRPIGPERDHQHHARDFRRHPAPADGGHGPRARLVSVAQGPQARLGPRRHPDLGRRGAEAGRPVRGVRPVLSGRRRDLERRRIRRQRAAARRRAGRHREHGPAPRPLRPTPRVEADRVVEPLCVLWRLLHVFEHPGRLLLPGDDAPARRQGPDRRRQAPRPLPDRRAVARPDQATGSRHRLDVVVLVELEFDPVPGLDRQDRQVLDGQLPQAEPVLRPRRHPDPPRRL